MKILNSLLIALIFIAIFSCKKDKPEEEQKPKDEVQKKENCIIAFGTSYKNSSYKYIYNEDSNLINLMTFNHNSDSSASYSYINFKYNPQNQIIELHYPHSWGEYYKFYYDANERIEKSEYYGFEEKEDQYPKLLKTKKYEYNSEGQLIAQNSYNKYDLRYEKTCYFYNPEANIYKETDSTLYNKTWLGRTIDYEYDNKINPNYNLPFFEILNPAYFCSRNNIVTIVSKAENEHPVEINYTYTYTPEDLPEKISYEVTNPSGIFTVSQNFGYKCKE